MSGAGTRRVLAGIRVLDFSRYLAGPYCAALLGDLGADVIRVEPLGGGQDRRLAPVTEKGEGAIFLQLNRNKKSVALDQRAPEGREVVERLVQGADVVVTNMPPAALVRVGMDHASLKALRADIVSTNISGYGRDGPLKDRPSFDAVGQAMSGAAYLGGVDGRPSRSGSSYVDYGTGLAGALGTLAALMHRDRTGEGQEVDASLFATAHAFINAPHIEAAVSGRDHVPVDNRSPYSAPSDFVPARDGVVAVQVVGLSAFRRWAEVIGQPDLAKDARFATDRRRALHSEELSEAMTAWSRERTMREVTESFLAAGIPAGPVRSPLQAVEDPETWASGIFARAEHRDVKVPFPVARIPVRLASEPVETEMRFAAPGEHTREVLLAAGFGEARIRELTEAGILGMPVD